MHNKAIKFLNICFFLPFIYLISLEVILRLILFIFTLNADIFFYGLNKNINLSLHSIMKGEFYISNDYKVLDNANNTKVNNQDEIWIFGGSTSNRGFCDSKNLSWVDLLNIDLKKKNFSRNGVNSNFSINILKNQLENNNKPKIIIWANKINEILHVKRGSSNIDNLPYLFGSIKKTLKKNLVTFYFFDELLIRFFDKFDINIRQEKKILNIRDYKLSAENYYENTKKAIELSKLYDVKKFYIVSIFNKLNLNNTDTEFYNYYEDKVNKIINNNNSVNFINTKKYLNSHDKNRLLFCDSIHHNYDGKILTAKIISNKINDNK